MKTTQEVKLRQTNEATSWYNFLKAFPLWEIIKAWFSDISLLPTNNIFKRIIWFGFSLTTNDRSIRTELFEV